MTRRPSVRVIVVNAKGGQAAGPPLARWLRHRKPRHAPLVALVSEIDGPADSRANRIVDAITRETPKARIYRGDTDHGAREVAVIIYGRRLHVEGHETHRLNPGHGWNGATQDRWATVVRCLLDGRHKVAFVSTHAPTKRQGRVFPPLAQIVDQLHVDGYQVVVGGDMNVTDGRLSRVRRWATSLNLVAYASRVMWVLGTDGLELGNPRALPLRADISDHPTAVSARIRLKGTHRA